MLTVALRAQTPTETKDPLGRNTPQDSIFQFLEACHARNYSKALYYLDLRRLPPSERAKNGEELAKQLEDLLDDTSFDIATLSRNSSGDESDGLSADLEQLLTVHVGNQTLDLQLQRVELKAGSRAWLVSADSVARIPLAHQAVAETPFEKKIPQLLVTSELFDTPVWRWIALAVAAPVLWLLSGFLAWGVLAALRPVKIGRAHV